MESPLREAASRPLDGMAAAVAAPAAGLKKSILESFILIIGLVNSIV